MAETCEVEVWVMVDENGDYAVGKDQDTAQESYDSDIGAAGPKRVVKVTLTVPLPVPVELVGVVPAESVSGCTLTVK